MFCHLLYSQADQDLGYISSIVVTNRLSCCQARIVCWQLELVSSLNDTIYTFPFSTTSNTYTFVDPVLDTTSGISSCYAPPPPPPAPPLSVLCPGRQGELFRYLRFSYKGGTGCGPSFNTYLQVAEVQVFAGTYNLAQDKPTSALDIWGNSLLPKYMTDGKTATFYHSSTVTSATFSQIDMMVRSAPGHGADTAMMASVPCISDTCCMDLGATIILQALSLCHVRCG
jgi:hypothetical protein